MEDDLILDDDIDAPEENGKKVFGITWCMIYSVLGLIGTLIIVALIPLYVPNRGVEAPKNTDTLSDLWKIEFETNYHYVGTRISIQIDKRGLSKSLDQSFGFKVGIVVVDYCEFIRNNIRDSDDKRRRRQETTPEIGANGTDFFNVYTRIDYPPYCFDNAICKSSFRQRCLDKTKDSRIHNMEVPLIDGQTLRFKGRIRSLTEYYHATEPTSTITSTLFTTETAVASITTDTSSSTSTTIESTVTEFTTTESTTVTTNGSTNTIGTGLISGESTSMESVTGKSETGESATGESVTMQSTDAESTDSSGNIVTKITPAVGATTISTTPGTMQNTTTAAPTCNDGIMNQRETSVDCGGQCGGNQKCAINAACGNHTDCNSQWCSSKVCVDPCVGFKYLYNIDYQLNDIRQAVLPSNNITLCCLYCRQTGGCNTFVFTPGRTCYAKNKRGIIHPTRAGYTTAYL